MTRELSLRILPQEAYNEQSIMAYLQQKEGIKAQAIRVLKRSIDARQRTIYVNLTVRIYVNEDTHPVGFFIFHFQIIIVITHTAYHVWVFFIILKVK